MKSRGLVMVVDGDAETRKLLSTYLDRVGHEACVAASGQQALDMILRGPAPAAIDFGDKLLLLVRQPAARSATVTAPLVNGTVRA